MHYFQAIKIGQKRVESTSAYLNSIENDRAMPALALRDNQSKICIYFSKEKTFHY